MKCQLAMPRLKMGGLTIYENDDGDGKQKFWPLCTKINETQYELSGHGK